MPDKRMAPGGPDAILPAFAELHFSFFPGEHRPYPMGVKKLPFGKPVRVCEAISRYAKLLLTS